MGITGGFTSYRPQSVKTSLGCRPCRHCHGANHVCTYKTLKRSRNRCKRLSGDTDPGWDNVVRAAEEDR